MPVPARDAFRLADCEILATVHRIRHPRRGETRVEPKAMEVLLCLVAADGAVVGKDELLAAVWPGRYVTEGVLSRSISALRKALGDDARAPRIIETIPTRGFRLLAPCEALEAEPLAMARPQATTPPRRRTASLPGLAVAAGVALALAAGWLAARRLGGGAEPEAVVLPITAELGSEIDPALSADGRTVVFAWNEGHGDDFDLYVAPVAGGTPRRLTRGRGTERDPAWSPDTRTIAFVRTLDGEAGIYLVAAAGGAERRLATLRDGDVADLDWAPDGASLFVADRPAAGAATALLRVDTRSGERHWVTNPPVSIYGDRDLAVSPDSRRIAFARAVLPGLEDLHVVDIATGAVRRLSFDGASINGLAWLPASDEVLFSSSRGGSNRLWRIGADGRGLRVARGLPEGALDPDYVARARRLAFERRSFDTNVWLLTLTGPAAGRRRMVSPSTRWDANPSLSLDGGRIALVSDRSGATALWSGELAAPEGLRPTTIDGALQGQPSWSPDGRRLAIAVLHDGQSDIVLIDRASGARTVATASPANEVCPVFTADGGAVLYSSDADGEWALWRVDTRGGRAVRLRADGGLCPRPSRSATTYFTRPGRNGLWEAPLQGGRATLVAGSEQVSPWVDWDLAGDALYVRPLAEAGAASPYWIRLAGGAGRREPVPGLPGAPFPGLGLSLAGDGSFLVYASLDGSDGDLLRVDGYR